MSKEEVRVNLSPNTEVLTERYGGDWSTWDDDVIECVVTISVEPPEPQTRHYPGYPGNRQVMSIHWDEGPREGEEAEPDEICDYQIEVNQLEEL